MNDDKDIPDLENPSLQYKADAKGRIFGVVSEQLIKAEFGDLNDERLARLHRTNRRRLLEGEITTVTYYRDLLDMTQMDLSTRTGIRRRRVRRHETPKGFRSATVSELNAYARVFGVPLAGMLCLFEGDWKDITIQEASSGLATYIKRDDHAPD